jgi:outer membrane protein assembly factor BamB
MSIDLRLKVRQAVGAARRRLWVGLMALALLAGLSLAGGPHASPALASPPELPSIVVAGSDLAGSQAVTQTTYLPLMMVPHPVSSPVLGNWSQFRGDAQHTAATNQELSGNLAVRWKHGFAAWPSVFAELVVVNAHVYLANTDGKVTCMDGLTGNTCWEFDTGAPIVTTPAVADGRLHVVTIKGRVVTLDALTGQELWEYTVPGDVYGSPALANGKLFFGTVNGVFYAFDAAQGGSGPLWSYPVGAMIDTAPVELNGNVIFGAEDMKAYALDTGTGQVVWTTNLTGERTWNGHPVASITANRVYFSMLTQFSQTTSTYREVVDADLFRSPTYAGGLNVPVAYVDGFISQNRPALQPGMLLNGSTGQPVTDFTVAPTNQHISGLPFTHYYWGAIRPALWQGNILYLQGMQRNILIDLTTNRIYQPNANQSRTDYFVRGDEQVPTSIGGNHAFGGMGTGVDYLDLTNGNRGNLLGTYGSQVADGTPLTAPLASGHYRPSAGDGYSERSGTFIVANGYGYYEQYGWVYCFNGTVTVR